MTNLSFSSASVFAIALIAVAVPSAAADDILIVASNATFAPATITLEVGRTYTLHLSSVDKIRAIDAPQIGLAKTTFSKTPSTVVVTPTKAGTYVAHCDANCGAAGSAPVTFIVRDASLSKPTKAGNPCAVPQ